MQILEDQTSTTMWDDILKKFMEKNAVMNGPIIMKE